MYTTVHPLPQTNRLKSKKGRGFNEVPLLGLRGAAGGLKIRTYTVLRTKSVLKETVKQISTEILSETQLIHKKTSWNNWSWMAHNLITHNLFFSLNFLLIWNNSLRQMQKMWNLKISFLVHNYWPKLILARFSVKSRIVAFRLPATSRKTYICNPTLMV